jgi:ankyrin repeat protein
MKNHKLFIIIVLIITFFTITGCKTKNEPKVEVLTQTPGQPGRMPDSSPKISIHEAALNGQSAEVARNLAEGVNVNTQDQDGRTALMFAAYNGHTEIMEKLIQKGASVNLYDSYGRTALMFASSGTYPDAVKLLLKSKADPNMADKEEHFTALMYAAAEGQLENARLLITYKADPTLKDIDGDNAMTFAANNGHKEVVDLLRPFLK